MKWVLAFHIIFMVAWFAGLFYLPRLFVYHAASTDVISNARFKVMEHKLYYVIMTPAAALTTIFGVWLLFFNFNYYWHAGWMQGKLVSVIFLWAYHLYCGKLVADFKYNRNRFRERYYRIFNEIPTIFLMLIVILVIVKP